MFFWLAEANTSAGAPDVIWVASAELPAKLKVTVVPGFAASKALPIAVNDSFSDAAANTVIDPLAELLDDALDDELADPLDDALAEALVEEVPDELELPQAASDSASTAVPVRTRGTRRMGYSFRAASSSRRI